MTAHGRQRRLQPVVMVPLLLLVQRPQLQQHRLQRHVLPLLHQPQRHALPLLQQPQRHALPLLHQLPVLHRLPLLPK